MTVLAAESTNPLIPPVGEIIVGLVAFLILAVILMKFVWPAFEKSYSARAEAIEGGIERAEAAQKEAKAALEKYNSQLAGARAEAAKIREDARSEGQQILDDMRTQAQAESDRISARGAEQLQAQRQQVVSELRQQVGSMAVTLAGRIVGESLQDDARTASTVDRFLDELDNVDAQSAKSSSTPNAAAAIAGATPTQSPEADAVASSQQDTLFGDGQEQS